MKQGWFLAHCMADSESFRLRFVGLYGDPGAVWSSESRFLTFISSCCLSQGKFQTVGYPVGTLIPRPYSTSLPLHKHYLRRGSGGHPYT